MGLQPTILRTTQNERPKKTCQQEQPKGCDEGRLEAGLGARTEGRWSQNPTQLQCAELEGGAEVQLVMMCMRNSVEEA